MKGYLSVKIQAGAEILVNEKMARSCKKVSDQEWLCLVYLSLCLLLLKHKVHSIKYINCTCRYGWVSQSWHICALSVQIKLYYQHSRVCALLVFISFQMVNILITILIFITAYILLPISQLEINGIYSMHIVYKCLFSCKIYAYFWIYKLWFFITLGWINHN